MSDNNRIYPNAGPGCDYCRYRTGETPAVGDLIAGHGDAVKEADARSDYRPNREVKVEGITAGGLLITSGGHYYAARFDLLSRAPEPSAEVGEVNPFEAALRKRHNGYCAEARAVMPGLHEPATPEQAIDELIEEARELAIAEAKILSAPSPPAAIEDAETCQECDGSGQIEHMTIVGERPTSCPSCRPASSPETCGLCGSAMRDGSCTGDPDGCVMVVTDGSSAAPGDAVVKGPGKYRTAGFDRTGNPCDLVEIVGKMTLVASEGLHWVGVIGGTSTAFFGDDGECSGPEEWTITGPFVASPKPEITLTGLIELLNGAPEKLEALALWNDRIYPTLRKADGSPLANDGDEVQRDLRQFAFVIRQLKNLNASRPTPPKPVSEGDLRWLATFLYSRVIQLAPRSLNTGEKFQAEMIRAKHLVAAVNASRPAE